LDFLSVSPLANPLPETNRLNDCDKVRKIAMTAGIFADRSLSCRLERAEGLTNAQFVEARARLMPELGAKWISVAGALAMFDGADSPLTQTFGLGLFQMPTVAELTGIEDFFKQRGARVFHEVSPLADKGLLALLGERYRPFELSNVMFLPLSTRVPGRGESGSAVSVRVAGEEEREIWARTSAEGWSEHTEFAHLMLEMGRVVATAKGNTLFLAELDGQVIGTGGLSIREGVALFAGASTIPAWRHRGAQRALLEARFQHARDAGCDLAMMCAEPGSSSQRNAERQGFHVAYTRTKWTLSA
jgi:GNAT superfamily N-acetyltransferase